ncbi:MAG TPA: hypothetical protein VLG50_06000 [Candidatus Saccharimonadales bacterium]|nr:hypothetical protein [Candidatus Saccharimonadales bacterium]
MLWFFASQYQWTTRQYTVPLCFYQNQERTISAPETVTIQISGPRKAMYQFNPAQSAVHVDASHFAQGDHEILLNRENLFLPDAIKLVNLIPSHIAIHISGKESE